jgi:hypothetical protein
MDSSSLMELGYFHPIDSEALVERRQGHLHELLAADAVEASSTGAHPDRKGAGLSAGSLPVGFGHSTGHICW